MYEGIIPLYKEKGMTSHDCVMRVRKLLQIKKVGHTGTLDPDVEGVLPICVGRATKIAEYLTQMPKQYDAEIRLGSATTTEDSSGEIVEEKPVHSEIACTDIKHVLQGFYGKQQQTPPMYSAVKVKGKRLYEYARAGKEVERPTRDIDIYYIQLQEDSLYYKENRMSFRLLVSCSKGTYIRTLCTDIGKALGYPAHMSDLLRTRSGPFESDEAFTLEELEKRKNDGTIDEAIQPISRGLSELERIEVDEETKGKIMHGSVLQAPPELDTDIFIFHHRDEILAVYQKHPTKEGLIKPKTMIKTK